MGGRAVAGARHGKAGVGHGKAEVRHGKAGVRHGKVKDHRAGKKGLKRSGQVKAERRHGQGRSVSR
ncbi:hypothetical protein ACFQO7_20220 [Catellatospora aurea]|uniref:Uncharacterized protein n=1 Tax=Catellatospora aurea TaxID=1337874 RepID=A0ABW2H0I1_9ACTN